MKKRLLTGIFGILLGLGLAMIVHAQPVQGENLPPGEDFILPCPGPGLCPGMGPGPNPKGRHHQGKGMRSPGPDMKGKGMGQGQSMEMRHHYMERMREQDPQRHQRMIKIQHLAMEYRHTDNQAKKQEIEKELRPLLEQELKAQQADAKERVAHMEKKLVDLRKVLKQRDEHWNEVVDFNFKKITGQVDYLEFPPPPMEISGPPPPLEPKK